MDKNHPLENGKAELTEKGEFSDELDSQRTGDLSNDLSSESNDLDQNSQPDLEELDQVEEIDAQWFLSQIEKEIRDSREKDEANSFNFHSRHPRIKEEEASEAQADSMRERIEWASILMSKLGVLKEEGITGEGWSYMGVKDSNSFLIGTEKKGLKLVEDGTKFYSAKLSEEAREIKDIVYFPPLNCYFFAATSSKLYRKDIDDKPPYLFMKLNCGNRELEPS